MQKKNFEEFTKHKDISNFKILGHKTDRFNSNENIYTLANKNFLSNNLEYVIPSQNLKLNENGDIEENHIEEIRKNLTQCENTLPGYIISVMLKRGQPIFEDELFEMIMPKINDLRKPDGSKYKKNFLKVIKSTLSCSGIFYKTDSIKSSWYFKNKEAFFYSQRTANKSDTRKEGKNISDLSSINLENVKENILQKTRKIKKTLGSHNYKIIKAYNILDNLLTTYKQDRDTSKKLKNPFSNCENSFDLIKKCHGDENKIFGILATFKFFKPLSKNYYIVILIVSKMLKIMSHHQKKPRKKQLTKLNMKMEDLENKLELFQQLFSKLGDS